MSYLEGLKYQDVYRGFLEVGAGLGAHKVLREFR